MKIINTTKSILYKILTKVRRARNIARRGKIKEFNAIHRKDNVALFHTGRCGSTVLGSMLNQHPNIFWASEIFEQFMGKGRKRGRDDFAERTIIDFQSLMVSKIFGFETKYLPKQHLSENVINMGLEDYVCLLRRLGFTKFVVLHRKNYLRQEISTLVGLKTGKWHSRWKKEFATKVRVGIDSSVSGVGKESLLELFRLLDTAHNKLVSLLSPDEAIFLSYEDDILDDPGIAYRKVCRFLGIDDASPTIKLKRTNPFSYDELVENIDEVKKALKDTEYSWMLDD